VYAISSVTFGALDPLTLCSPRPSVGTTARARRARPAQGPRLTHLPISPRRQAATGAAVVDDKGPKGVAVEATAVAETPTTVVGVVAAAAHSAMPTTSSCRPPSPMCHVAGPRPLWMLPKLRRQPVGRQPRAGSLSLSK